MPIATNLIVTTKNGNKTKTTNITYANPEAADSSLATFAASVFSLSQNELVSIERVNKSALDLPAPEPAAELLSPNLTVTMNGNTVGNTFEMEKQAGYSSAYFDVSRNGSGVITVADTQNWMSFNSSSNQITQSFGKWEPDDGASTVVTVNLASDGTYDSASKVFTVTYTPPGMPEMPDTPEP